MIIHFCNSGALAGDFNMACDYILANNGSLDRDCYFRLYTWAHPTISLGYLQSADDVDIERCEEDGIQVVRRPTGGRAVLHWGELTYSLIYPLNGSSGKRVLREVYQKIHRALSIALNRLGAGVSFSQDKRGTIPHNPLCFASSAGTELVREGKKVVGSAQRLFDKSILQHGSILLSDYHQRLPQYLKIEERERLRFEQALRTGSGYLRISDGSELRINLAQAIAGEFNLELNESSLTEKNILEIEAKRRIFNLNSLKGVK